MATTKLKAGIAAAIIIASVATPLLVQHQAQATLREKDAAWRQRINEVAQLTADDQRLTKLLADKRNSQPSADSQLPELLKLRSEVGRLQQDLREMAAPPPAVPATREDQLASMKQMYSSRVDRLKQWLDANPSENIPEFQNLRADTWLTAIQNGAADNDLPSAASNLRANAEMDVMGAMWSALRKYGKDNNGQFPTDLSQLTPYLKTPIDDAILQRYEIVPANSLDSNLQPGGDWVITQKSPVNPELDLRSAYSLTDMRSAGQGDTNRWTLAQ